MTAVDQPSISGLLVGNLPRELILAVDEHLEVGARLAYAAGSGMHDGHLPSVIGQMRHFHMNERFAAALDSCGIQHSPIKGNSLVIGTAGIARIARFNIASGPWYNARRSKSRRVMSEANAAIEPLVQPGLFDAVLPITSFTVFFVAVFAREPSELPIGIDIAVPDHDMKGWLFRESLADFHARYTQTVVQEDRAQVTLKAATRLQDQDSSA